MDVSIREKELAIAIPNGLPSQFKNIIRAWDALGDDSRSFTFNMVKSRLLQEERRRDRTVKENSESVLFRRVVRVLLQKNHSSAPT